MDWLSRLYNLNVGVIGQGSKRHERPHKPCMILALLDLIESGAVTDGRVFWSNQVRELWNAWFEVVHRPQDKATPENPFFYLRGDGVWTPFGLDELGRETPLQAPPKVRELDAERIYARVDESLLALASNPAGRAAIFNVIVSRYFPNHRSALERHLGPDASVAEKEASDQEAAYRSNAFRTTVVDVYDHQCCACGLRIKIPGLDASFVEAAHIIPFSESRNDHPTNGIALCKNHHWAMDQHLISPDLGGGWAVSPIINPRRSNGEEELDNLREAAFLEPHEPAYRPDPDSIRWRLENLEQQSPR